MEATAVKHQSPRAAKFGSLIAEQAMVASTANETGNAEVLSRALTCIQSLTESLFLVQKHAVAPYAKAIQNGLSAMVQHYERHNSPKNKMTTVTVTLDITNKKTEFASQQAMLDWIHACLNCNVNNTEVQVAMATPATLVADAQQVDPRVLVVVNGGVAETYSDDGIDVVIFDFDNFNCREEEAGDAGAGVPFRFEDLAILANVPVEASPSSAADQPQG